MNMVINGMEYEPIDTPITEGMVVNCTDCDIFKARPPKWITHYPLCEDKGNKRAHIECCAQLSKGIKRIWKKVNKEE